VQNSAHLFVFCFLTACSCLPLVEGGQPPNTFVRTNLVRVPQGIQGPLALSCTEVIQVKYATWLTSKCTVCDYETPYTGVKKRSFHLKFIAFA